MNLMVKSRHLLSNKGYECEHRGLGKPAWGDLLCWDGRNRRFVVVWITTQKEAASVWDDILSDDLLRAMLTHKRGSGAMAGIVLVWQGKRCEMRSVRYE